VTCAALAILAALAIVARPQGTSKRDDNLPSGMTFFHVTDRLGGLM